MGCLTFSRPHWTQGSGQKCRQDKLGTKIPTQPEARDGNPIPQRAPGGKALGLSPGKLVTPLGRECLWDLGVLMILLSETVLSHFQPSLGVRVPCTAPRYPLQPVGATMLAREASFWMACVSCGCKSWVCSSSLGFFEPLFVWALTFLSFLQWGPERPGEKPRTGVVFSPALQ